MSQPSDLLTSPEREVLIGLMRSIRSVLQGLAQHGLMPHDGFASPAAFHSAMAALTRELAERSGTEPSAEMRAHAAEGARLFSDMVATLTTFGSDPVHTAALAVELAGIDGHGRRRPRAEARLRAAAMLAEPEANRTGP